MICRCAYRAQGGCLLHDSWIICATAADRSRVRLPMDCRWTVGALRDFQGNVASAKQALRVPMGAECNSRRDHVQYEFLNTAFDVQNAPTHVPQFALYKQFIRMPRIATPARTFTMSCLGVLLTLRTFFSCMWLLILLSVHALYVQRKLRSSTLLTQALNSLPHFRDERSA